MTGLEIPELRRFHMQFWKHLYSAMVMMMMGFLSRNINFKEETLLFYIFVLNCTLSINLLSLK